MPTAQSTDSGIVERDPALAGLAFALNDDALTERFGDQFGGPLRVTYLRYKPATSLTAAVARAGASAPDIFFTCYGPSYGEKSRKATEYSTRVNGEFAVDPMYRSVIGDAVADRGVPGIRTTHRHISSHEITVLRYKPARRWVARIDAGYSPYFVKAHAKYSSPSRPLEEQAVAVNERFARIGEILIPRPLTGDSRHRVRRYAWIDGDSVDHPGRSRAGYAVQAGELIASLHQQPVPQRNALQSRSAAPSLLRAARALPQQLAVVAPHLSPAATEAGNLIDAADSYYADTEPRRQCWIHGDYSSDQLMVDRATNAILLTDLDRATLGHPATDLATWLAAECLHYPTSVDDPLALITPLLQGYTHAGGIVNERALRITAAQTVLSRALEPFRLRAHNWPDRVEAMIDYSRQLVTDL